MKHSLFSPLSLSCIHPHMYQTPTHITVVTTQPSGGILDETMLVCYFLLYETWTYGKLLKSDSSLGVCLLNKKDFFLQE